MPTLTDTPKIADPNADPNADAKKKSVQAFLSLQKVTASCHGIVNTNIHPIDPVPDWYGPLSNNLDTAKGHAQGWLDTLGPQISATIPTQIIDYNSTFVAASDQIRTLLQNQPSGQDVLTALSLFEALIGQLEDIVGSVNGAKAQLKTFHETMQGDYTNLATGANSIQKAMAADQARIDKLNNHIKVLEDEIAFEQKQQLASWLSLAVGLFIFIVGVAISFIPGAQVAGGIIIGAGLLSTTGGAIGAGIWQSKIEAAQGKIAKDQQEISATNQQIVALSTLNSSIGSVMGNINDATTALTDVATTWDTFKGILDNVVKDLKKPNAQLKAVVDLMWLDAARNNWGQLQVFAEGLVGLPTSDVKILPLKKSA